VIFRNLSKLQAVIVAMALRTPIHKTRGNFKRIVGRVRIIVVMVVNLATEGRENLTNTPWQNQVKSHVNHDNGFEYDHEQKLVRKV
jgi:hypothetical protein